MIDDLFSNLQRRYHLRHWTWQGAKFPPCPDWLASDDLQLFFTQGPKVLRNGKLSWGIVVLADRHLHDRNDPRDGVAEVLYATRGGAATSVEHLIGVRSRLQELTGESEDPADPSGSSERMFGEVLPDWIAQGTPCAVSSTYIIRKHLPGRHLADYVVPILMSQKEPKVVAILPEYFWPKNFVSQWLNVPQAR